MREKANRLWPLAFCIAVALSCNLAPKTGESGGSDAGEGSSSSSSDDEVSELAGTNWKGTFKCDDGDEIQANYRFADSGNPIYEYQTNSGPREVELASPGQIIRFVPPGGGVTNIVLDEISVEPQHIMHTMSVSNERTSGGTLDQGHSTIQSEATLAGSVLNVEISIRGQNTVSQPGIMDLSW